MLPANKLGNGNAVAQCLKVQAAHDVGKLAADFARVQRVAPEFSQRGARELLGFVLPQAGSGFGLAAGHKYQMLRVFCRAKAIASSVAVSQACRAVTTSKLSGKALLALACCTDRAKNCIRAKPSCCASAVDFSTSSGRVSMP